MYNDDLIIESKKHFGVIYMLRNNIDGKIYIGQTINLHSRLKDYKYKKLNRKSNLYHIIKIVNEYGFNNFDCSIIDTCTSKNEMNEKEVYWISTLKANDPNIGYNKKTGGVGGTMNSESKYKMSESTKLFRHSEQTKRDKSKPIIAFKDGLFHIFQGAKSFADSIDSNKSSVTHAVRFGRIIQGYFVFYCDKNSRNEILIKIESKLNDTPKIKTPMLKLQYVKICKLIREDVETNENYYHIII